MHMYVCIYVCTFVQYVWIPICHEQRRESVFTYIYARGYPKMNARRDALFDQVAKLVRSQIKSGAGVKEGGGEGGEYNDAARILVYH